MLLTTIETHLPVQPACVPTVYTASVVSTLEEFAALEGEWIELVKRSGIVNINSDFGFLFTWANHFCPNNLFIIVVRNQFEELVGVAPFKISRPKRGVFKRFVRHLQFLGTEPDAYDEMQVILDADENAEAILQQVIDVLVSNQKRWDVLDLQFCPQLYQLSQIGQVLSKHCFLEQLSQPMSHPFMELPETTEVYRALKPKNVKKYKRHLNQLKEAFGNHEADLYFFETGDEMFEHLGRLAKRHIEFWGERGMTSVFKKYPTMKQFYQDLLTYYSTVPTDESELHVGRVSFSALKIDNEFVSYDIGFHMSNNEGYLGHMSTYDKRYAKFAPGFLQTEMLLHYAIEHNHTRCYYFGRGDEPHKAQWVNDLTPLWNLTLIRHPLVASLLQLDGLVKQMVLDAQSVVARVVAWRDALLCSPEHLKAAKP